MKIIYLFIFIIGFCNFANSNEVEVIELHENKSLDQIVLDQIDITNDENESKIESENTENSENLIIQDDMVEETKIEPNIFWNTSKKNDIEFLLQNSKSINSKVVKNEFSSFLENANLDLSDQKNREIYFSIINYFYKAGNISTAFDLINQTDLTNDINEDYYNMIKINYLLSTYQLEEVCGLKENYDLKNNITNSLLEKLDIFCLILIENYSEAELLNSILLETESNLDQNFQILYSLISSKNNEIENNQIEFNGLINKDLIFLYSAMLRIADLPLTEEFLNVDSKNLSIPIILNQSTPIELRLQAANTSYKNNSISIESLSALYQSVDFNSNQLNSPDKTIIDLSDSVEILMAYYFQLINIQIFPSERLQALISFWNFAKLHDLEDIAYSLSRQIINSVEISAENLEFGTSIATCFIYNDYFDKALEWINFYEKGIGVDDQSTYARILLDLYSANEINSIIDIIIDNSSILSNIDDKQNQELIFTLLKVLNKEIDDNLSKISSEIYDNRLMPSLFILEKLRASIIQNKYDDFLIYSVISLNEKEWKQLHPEHLNIILTGFLNYNDGELIKEIILEIFKDYKIL